MPEEKESLVPDHLPDLDDRTNAELLTRLANDILALVDQTPARLTYGECLAAIELAKGEVIQRNYQAMDAADDG